MPSLRSLLPSAALLVVACGPVAPPAQPSAPPPPAPAATTPTPPAPATTATTATAATAPPAATGQPVAAPAPLTEVEQREAERACKPIMDAMAARKKKGGGDPLTVLADVLKKPPTSLPADQAARCGALIERGLRAYLSAAKEVEAQVVLRRMGQAMAAVAQGNAGRLCPSSEHPVPADEALVATQPYVSTDADWSTPAWQCLGVSLVGQAQRFQYELRSDPQRATFELVARGVPGGDGRWVELVQRGTVSAKGIEMAPVVRR
jgi:Tfp pilus assembly protein FimV